MDEYIKREAAVTVCDEQYKECLRKSDFCGDTVAWNICADIKAIPAADVAPVVRCKDCRYAGVHVVVDTHEIVGHWCGLLDIDDVSDDDFCSFGKRKENEKDD